PRAHRGAHPVLRCGCAHPSGRPGRRLEHGHAQAMLRGGALALGHQQPGYADAARLPLPRLHVRSRHAQSIRRREAPIGAPQKNRTMMDFLFNGLGWTDIAFTLTRVAAGTFFMLSGYHKLFNAERHRVFVDELKALGVPAVGVNQWWVPTVEFTAGAAVLVGLLAPLAALGLLVIILVALATSGRQRLKLYKPIDRADRIDDWLYLPETLYAVM